MSKRIIVVGDLHGYWGHLNKLINQKHPDEVWVCGDFGYWPKFNNTDQVTESKKWNQYGIKNHDTIIRFVDGNHEDHWAIRDLDDHEIMPGVFHMPRGSVLNLDDGRNVLFIGGADSFDKKSRVLGVDWFPDEYVSLNDLYKIPKDCRIDIVVSHTCPKAFLRYVIDHNMFKANDPSYENLNQVLNIYKPTLWYFGHWHAREIGETKNCLWTCLNKVNSTGWWTWLMK